MKHTTIYASMLLATTVLSNSALAAEKTTLNPVVVMAESAGTKTVPSNTEAAEIINRTPGGVAVVGSEQFEDKYTLNFEDTLALTPGVYAQKRFGEEVRLSIRGSGLSRGFHLRGLTLLQDGIPFNLADGSSDFQEADSLAFQRLEVFKGANALQYGSTTLGGAINMVSKTAKSQPGERVRLEYGSDDTYRVNVQSGQVFGDSDVFLSLTGTSSRGYREHSDQENIKFNSNFGHQINDEVETRFYVSANSIEQELPGSVSLSTALNDPEAANSSAISQDWRRDIRSVRLSNKTTFEVDHGDTMDVGAFVNIKDLFHPITSFVGVIDQESEDYGFFASRFGDYDLAGYKNSYRVGVNSQFGEVKAKVFQNLSGSRGNATANATQESRNFSLYGENNFYLLPELALVTGGQLTWSERDLTDHFTPSESDSRIYRAFSPKLGLMYEPQDDLQLFANISKSHETPTFSELTQSGSTGFTPVDPQEAWTVEVGSRGEVDRFAWDVSAYRAWIDREMLQYSSGAGFPATTFNADKTIHQGLELGLDIRLADNLLSEGDHLKWKNAYTYSDYYFDGNVEYGDNAIAGQPQHFYQTELRYDHAGGWHAAVDWELASKADVAFDNSLEAPGYGIIGANGGYDINESVNLYIDGRNLLDKHYVSTFSTLADTTGSTAVFYPGEGRRIFGGVNIKF